MATTQEFVNKLIELTEGGGSADVDLSAYATTEYVNNAVAGVVDSAPEALNTLKELSAALNNDANFAATITNQLGEMQAKVDSAEENAANALSIIDNIQDDVDRNLNDIASLNAKITSFETSVAALAATVSGANTTAQQAQQKATANETEIDALKSQTWIKRVAGPAPTGQAEIAALTANMPSGSLIYFEG